MAKARVSISSRVARNLRRAVSTLTSDESRARTTDGTAEVTATEGGVWISIPGSESPTPVNGSVACEVAKGDTVSYRIENGRLSITGNSSTPSIGAEKAASFVEPVADEVRNLVEQVDASNARTADVVQQSKVIGGIANAAKSVADATNQHFFADDNGVHVTEKEQADWEQAHEGANMLLNSIGQLFRDGLTNLISITTQSGARAITFWDGLGNDAGNVTASFGADGTQIGKSDESHMALDYHSMQLVDAEGNTYFHVSDLRDEDGYVTDSFVGDGSTTSFSLTVTASSTAYVVSIDGVEQTSGVTKYTASFYFTSAPSTNAVVTARYMPLSNFKHLLKAYTLGKANENAKIGRFSLREGYNTAANAPYTHAEGYDTTAGGNCSHAEGRDTTASGLGSHAEGGDNNTASGMWSHAEGGGTLLNGVSTRPTSALGTGCHAEGCGTTAGSTSATEAAHAEGTDTVASGHNSHSEGYSTTASGNDSHAEGYQTSATYTASHAEGRETTASGYNSHAEGYGTTASGSGSIATTSHAEGCHTTASGANSHAEGYYTTASGGSNQSGSERSSHAEGNHTTASGDDSHAEGWYSEASGYDSHAEGGYTVASGTHSHAQNFNTKAVKTAQTAIGTFNEEDTSTTTVHPSGNTNHGKYAFIIGNGTADDARSNALTVDWSGNVEAAGTVTATLQESIVTASTDITTGSNNHCWHNGVVCTISLAFNLVSSLANGGTVTVGTVPIGYRPPYTVYGSVYNNTAGGGGVRGYLTNAGSIVVRNLSGAALDSTANLYISFTFAL